MSFLTKLRNFWYQLDENGLCPWCRDWGVWSRTTLLDLGYVPCFYCKHLIPSEDKKCAVCKKQRTKWKPLLPNFRYEAGDIVRTSDNPLGITVYRVVRAGTTDDLKLFREWQHIIEANRPLHFHETWDCGEVKFGLARKDDC